MNEERREKGEKREGRGGGLNGERVGERRSRGEEGRAGSKKREEEESEKRWHSSLRSLLRSPLELRGMASRLSANFLMAYCSKPGHVCNRVGQDKY